MSEFRRESEMAGPVVAWLESQGMAVRREISLPWGLCDVVGCRIDAEAAARRIAARKATAIRNWVAVMENNPDWLPLHERLVLVELKLTRVVEVLRQAYDHLVLGESYAALPARFAEALVGSTFPSWKRYRAEGVGLIAVTAESATILVSSTPIRDEQWRGRQAQITERFWTDKRLRAQAMGEMQDGPSCASRGASEPLV